MIDFLPLVPLERVAIVEDAGSQKSAILRAAKIIAATEKDIDHRLVLEGLLKRESIGSTAFEECRAAIPHCRLANCKTPTAAFLKLEKPVDFDGVDVDILFVLVVPSEKHELHLEILSQLAQLFMADASMTTLRRADNAVDLHRSFHELMNLTSTK